MRDEPEARYSARSEAPLTRWRRGSSGRQAADASEDAVSANARGRPPNSGMGPVVVVAEAISRAAVDLLSASCDVVEADGETRRGLFTRLADAAGLIVRSATSVDDGLLDAAPRLRVVGRAGVGVDNIDLASASARGVLVVNAPKSNTISAAEHTFALLLGLARHLPRADQQLRSGLWNRKEFQGVEVYGKRKSVV